MGLLQTNKRAKHFSVDGFFQKTETAMRRVTRSQKKKNKKWNSIKPGIGGGTTPALNNLHLPFTKNPTIILLFCFSLNITSILGRGIALLFL